MLDGGEEHPTEGGLVRVRALLAVIATFAVVGLVAPSSAQDDDAVENAKVKALASS